MRPSLRARYHSPQQSTEVGWHASGNVSLGNHMISAGLPRAGQRVTLRLDGPVAHILSGGILAPQSPVRPAPVSVSPHRAWGAVTGSIVGGADRM
jgi:hypothetical protein